MGEQDPMPDDQPVTLVWQQPRLIRLLATASVVWFLGIIATLLTLALTVLADQPVVWFLFGAGLLNIGWGGYWICWRLTYRLALTPTVLKWRTMLRSGHVSPSQIRDIAFLSMTPWLGSGRLLRIRVATGRPILTRESSGIDEFVRHLRQVAPHLDVNQRGRSGSPATSHEPNLRNRDLP